MIGTIYIKSRPIRLGFLVDPRNAQEVKDAIVISSTLWGGTHNPFIPIFAKKAPKVWKDLSKAVAPESIVKGYIDAYDPDVLVQCSKQNPDYLKKFGLQIVGSQEILKDFLKTTDDYLSRFSISVLEVLNLIYDKHFRYSDRYRPKVVIPQLPVRFRLFWSSLFGQLSDDVLKFVENNFKEPLEITTPSFAIDELANLLDPSVLFPRRIGQYQLEPYRERQRWFNENVVFVMDARKSEDIVDYWNLRALGMTVLPVPIQFDSTPQFKKTIEDFILEVRQPLEGNPQVWDRVTFVKSRFLTSDRMLRFAKSLNLPKLEGTERQHPYFVMQNWYPRIWDDWARNSDQAHADRFVFESKSFEYGEIGNEIQLPSLFPQFAHEDFYRVGPRWANEIDFPFFGGEERVAFVIPRSGGINLAGALSPITAWPNEWRGASSGIVRLVRGSRNETWKIPSAGNVFLSFLKDVGWEAKLSAPGIVANNLYAQFQGIAGMLGNEDLLKLLNHMSTGPSGERELTVGEVKARLRTIYGNDNFLNFFSSRGVFIVGIRVQCPSCTKKSWFSVDDLGSRMVCPRCAKNFAAIGNIESANWCYRTAGPFSIPGYADGAYCVLLATDFFNKTGGLFSNFDTTTVHSFEARNIQGEKLESDFGLLWKERRHGETTNGILFGECKTFDRFKPRDISRMRKVGRAFPGAVIAFCTLRKELTTTEIRYLTQLAKTGRRYWKNEQPRNPLLILTGNEILGDRHTVPDSWKAKNLEPHYNRLDGLINLCDLSQQVYLGLPSWTTLVSRRSIV